MTDATTRPSAVVDSATRRAALVAWLSTRRWQIAYLTIVVWFGVRVGRYYDAHTGFTSMLVFGDAFAAQRLHRLKAVPIYTFENSKGYDAQFYGQIAVTGNPLDPELRTALDSPAYRARRSLIPELAHIIGLGRPAWILNAYALSNVFTWLLLAWLLARWWFPPTDLHNLIRWAGTLCGAGVLTSVSRALSDGPALLLIAGGVRCLEVNRLWLGAGVLGAAGLVRETSMIAAAALYPPDGQRWRWPRALLAASVCVLPTVSWTAVLFSHYGAISKGALDLPLVGFIGELRRVFRGAGVFRLREDISVIIAVGTQVGFIAWCSRRREPWWRIGFSFAILTTFLGSGFWDDAITGVPRTIAPLTLAFNVLAPRTWRGTVLLLAGNLTILSASSIMAGPSDEQTTFVEGISCRYVSGWHGPEHLGTRTWRWASGPAVMSFNNPASRTFRAELVFDVISTTDRVVDVSSGGLTQSISLQPFRRAHARFSPFLLPPGITLVAFDSTGPPSVVAARPLTFSVQNLRLALDPGLAP